MGLTTLRRDQHPQAPGKTSTPHRVRADLPRDAAGTELAQDHPGKVREHPGKGEHCHSACNRDRASLPACNSALVSN